MVFDLRKTVGWISTQKGGSTKRSAMGWPTLPKQGFAASQADTRAFAVRGDA